MSALYTILKEELEFVRYRIKRYYDKHRLGSLPREGGQGLLNYTESSYDSTK